MPKPVTAIQHGADVARAITDGELVLAQSDVPASPERVLRAMMGAYLRREIEGGTR